MLESCSLGLVIFLGDLQPGLPTVVFPIQLQVIRFKNVKRTVWAKSEGCQFAGS